MKCQETGEHVDQMFRAFSDRNRLRILHLLVRGELCVGDIVEILQLPQPRVSRHLAYLRKAGLTTVRKDGLWKYYGLAKAQSPFHKIILGCLTDCFAEVPELKADDARAAIVKRQPCCTVKNGRAAARR